MFLLELVSRPMQNEGNLVQPGAAPQRKTIARIVSFEPIEHVHGLIGSRKTEERHALFGRIWVPLASGNVPWTLEHRTVAPTKR
jgi:hypothetical protein